MSRLERISKRLEKYQSYPVLLSPGEAQDIEILLEVADAVRALLRADHEYALATEAEISAEAEVSAATDALRAALAKLEEVK